MLKPEDLNNLKRLRIAVHPEMTRVRLREAWINADKQKREEILALAGITEQAIQLSYRTGNVTARTVVSIAQVTQVDPFYLIGHSDKPSPYSDELVKQFLGVFGDMEGKRQLGIKGQPKLNARAGCPQAAAAGELLTPAALLPNSVDGRLKLDAFIEQLFTLADKDVLDKVSRLKEDGVILLLKSLRVQAGVSGSKQRLIAFIYYLLLMA